MWSVHTEDCALPSPSSEIASDKEPFFFSLFRLAIIVLFLFFLCLALGSHFFDNNTPVQLAFHIGTSEYIGHMETPQTYGCPNEQHHTTYLHIVYGMY